MIAANMNLEIHQAFISKGLKLTFPENLYDWCIVITLKFDQIELVNFLYENGPKFILYDHGPNFIVPRPGKDWVFDQNDCHND